MSRSNNLLTILILVGLVAGVVVGQILHVHGGEPIGPDHWTKAIGDLVLIRPLTLLIIPIVFVSVLVGVTSIGDPSKLGVVGGSTILYYLATMLLAVTLGTTLVSVIKPGVLPEETRSAVVERGTQDYETSDEKSTIEERRSGEGGLGTVFKGLLDQLIPKNIIAEMAAGRTLPVIVFALMLGLALAAGGERTEPAVRVFEALFDALMRLVLIIIWVTPVGVFLLMAWTVGKIGLTDLIGPIFKYVATVLLGLSIHGLIVLPLILWLFARINPYRFMWKMKKALMTAFGTDSSSATLPVTIETAENEGGCSKRASNFVLPLGSTINMDGTALYEAVAVVFLFQLFGIELGFTELLVVVMTATLAAVGAAGIPSAGVVMMVIVITAVNKTLGGSVENLDVSAIGVILGVDRIVDMCRTTVNVWGDAVGARIITTIAPDLEEELEMARA